MKDVMAAAEKSKPASLPYVQLSLPNARHCKAEVMSNCRKTTLRTPSVSMK
jgi:hypothetical protein